MTFLQQISALVSLPPQPRQRARNTFRPMAVEFDESAQTGLTCLRRLMAYDIATQGPRSNGLHDLQALADLLPTETQTVVLEPQQHARLDEYLRLRIYQLLQQRHSMLPDVTADDLYGHLLAVQHCLNDYTTVYSLPLYVCGR